MTMADNKDNAIALQVQTPNAMNTMSNIMNIANTSQQVQQGQMDLQERNSLRDLSQNLGKYKTEDGNLDLNSLVNDATQAAPKLGMEWVSQIARAHAETIGVNKSLNELSEQQRAIVGKVVESVADQPFDVQQKALTAIANANPRLKFPVEVGIRHLKSAWDTGGQDAAKSTAYQIAKATVGVPEQNDLNTGKYVNTGGSLKQTSPMAAAAGAPEQIENTLPPNTPTVDGKNVPTYTGRTATGERVAAGPAPGVMQNIADLQKEVGAIRQAGDQVPVQRNTNQQILQLSKDTKTGPGSQFWQKGMAALNLPSGTNYQELGKYLEKNAIQAMQTMGGSPSDARLSAAVAANGSTEFNPGALQAVTKFNDATVSALEKYRQGMDKAVGVENPDFAAAARFKADWAKNLDIDVFRVENALRDRDVAELDKIKKELGPKKMKDLAQKIKNLDTLGSTGKLP